LQRVDRAPLWVNEKSGYEKGVRKQKAFTTNDNPQDQFTIGGARCNKLTEDSYEGGGNATTPDTPHRPNEENSHPDMRSAAEETSGKRAMREIGGMLRRSTRTIQEPNGKATSAGVTTKKFRPRGAVL